MSINGTEWTKITYDQIVEGMRILTVEHGPSVTYTREGIADKRTHDDAWWSQGTFLVADDSESTIYTTTEAPGTTRRTVRREELHSLIGATIERTETFKIEKDSSIPDGWHYTDIPAVPTRYVVVSDPDAAILTTIRHALDVTDPAEADEMARQVLTGLREAGVEL